MGSAARPGALAAGRSRVQYVGGQPDGRQLNGSAGTRMQRRSVRAEFRPVHAAAALPYEVERVYDTRDLMRARSTGEQPWWRR